LRLSERANVLSKRAKDGWSSRRSPIASPIARARTAPLPLAKALCADLKAAGLLTVARGN